jgi:hypothetical protein
VNGVAYAHELSLPPPTLYEGRCTWLEFGSEAIPVTPCLPNGYENQDALGLAVHALGNRSILAGECGYHAVEVVHQDGSSRTVDCTGGIVFTELTQADETGQVPRARPRGPSASRKHNFGDALTSVSLTRRDVPLCEGASSLFGSTISDRQEARNCRLANRYSSNGPPVRA